MTTTQAIPPAVEFWAIPRSGAPFVLRDVKDFQLSRVVGGAGAGTVSLDYPDTGQDFTTLAAIDQPNAELEIEVRVGGTSTGARRALLQTAKGDPTARGSTWTFTGNFLGILMKAAVTAYESGDEKGETRFSASPGRIMRQLIARAQNRGVLTGISTSFTDTHDSRGVPWPSGSNVVVSWSPGRDYLTILQELEEDLAVAEWDMSAGRVLHLYAYGTRGVDRTVPGSQVTLEWGRDILDAPVTGDNVDGGTRVLGAGAEGLYRTATNSTAEAQRGRAIEVFRSWNSVQDASLLQALVQQAASIVGDGTHEYAHELTLAEGCPLPGRDFDVSDWVLRSVGGVTQRVKVAQHVLKRAGDVVTATVGLGDLLDSAEVRTRRLIERMASGAATVGTSTATPETEVDDGKPPATPTGLTAGSNAYKEGRNNYALVSVGWLPVQKNSDGTDATDIAGYRVEWRAASGDGGWVLGGEVQGTSASFGRVPVNLAIQVRVQCLDKWSRVSGWSATVQLTTTTDTTPPPSPSVPTLFNYIGLIVCEWDGLGSAGERMPLDFDYIEVHCSTTANFTPDRPADMSTSTTFVGLQMGAGQTPYAGATELPIGTNVYFRLVAVDNLGNASAPSATSVLATQAIEDGDIASVNIGKLTAGELKAILTISQAIQTAATGSRVRIDTAGLWCYNAAGTEVLSYRIATGLMRMVGEVLVQGTGGAKIELLPQATPVMYLHSANQTIGPAFINATPESGGTTGLGLNSGDTNNSSTLSQRRSTRLWMRPDFATFNRIDGNQNNRGGHVRIDNVKAELSYHNTAGTRRGAVESQDTMVAIDSGGTARLEVKADGYIMARLSGGGYGELWTPSGPSQSVKSFVVPHPQDDPDQPERWLVHGCTESPTAAVEYEGTAEIRDHAAVVELPGYFEGLCEEDGRTVQVTPLLSEDPTDPVEFHAVAASIPHDGRFRIACSGPDGTRVSWRVRATRRDADFEVEPRRSDYDAHGDGPYRYLTRRVPAVQGVQG